MADDISLNEPMHRHKQFLVSLCAGLAAGMIALVLRPSLALPFGADVFFVAYTCMLPYLVLFIAYVPSRLLAYNNLGDYSYGVYIYAFPVQQAIVAVAPGISVIELVASAFLVTLLLAVASWHLVEVHALALKKFARPSAAPPPIGALN